MSQPNPNWEESGRSLLHLVTEAERALEVDRERLRSVVDQARTQTAGSQLGARPDIPGDDVGRALAAAVHLESRLSVLKQKEVAAIRVLDGRAGSEASSGPGWERPWRPDPPSEILHATGPVQSNRLALSRALLVLGGILIIVAIAVAIWT
jgi:hypothetical protein